MSQSVCNVTVNVPMTVQWLACMWVRVYVMWLWMTVRWLACIWVRVYVMWLWMCVWLTVQWLACIWVRVYVMWLWMCLCTVDGLLVTVSLVKHQSWQYARGSILVAWIWLVLVTLLHRTIRPYTTDYNAKLTALLFLSDLNCVLNPALLVIENLM